VQTNVDFVVLQLNLVSSDWQQKIINSEHNFFLSGQVYSHPLLTLASQLSSLAITSFVGIQRFDNEI